MKRQPVTDRNFYDYEDREFVLTKSDGVCAHCGKKIFNGGQASIDHFVPLNKGGINNKVNLIPLCRPCNKKKGNKIVSPKDYIRYLKPKYLNEVTDYFESYISSFEYVDRKNLLCCDEYVIKIVVGPQINVRNKKKAKSIEEKMTRYFTFERMTPTTRIEVEKFYIEYLKKYNLLASEDVARKNIEFWNRFGAIYFVKNADGEICIMSPITVKKYKDDEHALHMYVFARYATGFWSYVINILPEYVALNLVQEQKLPYIRIETEIPVDDKNSKYLLHGKQVSDMFIRDSCMFNAKPKEECTDFVEKDNPFYMCFTDIKNGVERFFSRNGYETIDWMGECVIPGFSLRNVQAAGDA